MEDNIEKKEKTKQIIFMLIVILAIGGLVLTSFFLNKKQSNNTIKNNENLKNEVSVEELFEQAQKDREEREQEGERIVSETGSALELTMDTFEEKVLKADKPVLLDFYAAWCGPCQTMSPIVEELAEEQDDFYVYKINTDLQPELSVMHEVFTIPTFVVYKDGKVTNSTIGVNGKAKLIEIVNNDAK